MPMNEADVCIAAIYSTDSRNVDRLHTVYIGGLPLDKQSEPNSAENDPQGYGVMEGIFKVTRY